MNPRSRRERAILRDRRRGFEIEPSFTLWNIVSGMYSAYYIMRLATDPVLAQQVKERAQMITDIFKGVSP